jgi:uncharacterized protein YgfB (UPF0149 family)
MAAGLHAARRKAAAATLWRPTRPGAYVPEALPTLAEVDAQLGRLETGASAVEVHGGLCGWLAGGGANTPDWLARVLADDSLAAVTEGPLQRLREATVGQLEDRGFGFELLLPDADASLRDRSGALFEWCRGFLGGFGLAAGAAPPLSDEGKEALADLARLAAATAQDDGDQEDEDALAEIEEFVRVAVLLVHGDCVLAPRHRQQFN